MANQSYAQGTIIFKGFTKEEIKIFIQHNISAGYGFNDIDGDTFSGSGRWSFSSTLKNLHWNFIPKGGRIELDFVDEEPGCALYYHQHGVIEDDGQYISENTEYYNLEETLNIPEFSTVHDLMYNIEDFGWATVEDYENGNCPEIWEIENEKGEKREIDIETVMSYDKLVEELEKE